MRRSAATCQALGGAGGRVWSEGMSTADPHPAPNDPTLPPLNDPIEEPEEPEAS